MLSGHKRKLEKALMVLFDLFAVGILILAIAFFLLDLVKLCQEDGVSVGLA